MIVRLIVLVIAWSITCVGVELAETAEGLADPVEDDDRLVHRVAQHRQHRRQHRQRELPLEEGEEAQDDDDVVQVGDDGGDRELPLEAERQVDHDAHHHDGQRLGAVLRVSSSPTAGPTDLAARQRTGSAPPALAQTGCATASPLAVTCSGEPPAGLGLAQRRRRPAPAPRSASTSGAHRQADHHVARAAEVLHLHVAVARAFRRSPRSRRCRRSAGRWPR